LNSTTGSTLAGNFQTFLTLLTTQLQNQDPLSPLDTNQFTQQLVQFASVEQQLKTNDQLTTLVSLQQTAQSTQALTFVQDRGGRRQHRGLTNASATGISAFRPIQRHHLDRQQHRANRLHRQLRRQRRQQSGLYLGRQGNDGTQWPDGKYKLTATAADTAGNAVAVSTRSRRGQFGRSHPVAAVTVDQRPNLHGQPDQEHRRQLVRRFFGVGARLCNTGSRDRVRVNDRLSHSPLRPGVSRPRAEGGIFKEIRIEALGLGKFKSGA